MYTQGSHNPHPGQGPQKPMSSLYQQHLPGPPPPLPQFQQGPLGFTSYQRGPPAPHQIPPGGLSNTGQSYLHPPVHVHGAAPLPHMYSTAQQNSQHHSHLATQNTHNMPQPVLPPISAPHPEVSQTQPPSRALRPPHPPPQSQGQTFYRAPVNLPPQQPGLKHISSHPSLPPTTSFFTSAPLGNFIHSSGGDHHVLSTATLPPPPPPPLSFPPPSLPSRPPSTPTPFSSSKPVQNAFNLPCNLDSDGSKLSASGFVDEVATPIQVKHNLVADNGSLNMGGGNGCDMGSLVGDKLSLQEGLTMDLSSSPPKPTDKNVLEKIEALCHCIAKNGPDYEDMVHKNESGNPEYSFLYGGEPGSEAAVAHDFFSWMKKKSILACKSDKQQEDSSLRPSENMPSEQPYHLVIAAASHSLDDSDMEMEDDITQIDDDQGMNHSSEGLNSQCDINDNMLNVEEQTHPLQVPPECNAYKGILCEKDSASGSSRLGPEGITNADQMVFGASVSKVVLVKLTVPTAHSLVTSLEKSNTSGQLAKDGSPVRLLQDYASDDNSEKDVETCIANTGVSFCANLGRDAGSSLLNVSSPRQIEKEFVPHSLSSMPCAVVSSEVVEGTITTSIINGNEHAVNKHVQQVSINHAASGEVLQKENVVVGASVDSVKFSKEHRQEGENLTLGSTQHKVDKFGRLVRNGASDSDSDDLHYLGRHKRGRTRSRSPSCSTPDRRRRRRRSPWRRREKRSLSRSWSPRNRRSRSRSPRNRRSRSRSPKNRRSRSRSPRNRRSRSRSPKNRRSRSRSPRNRRSRSRSPRNRRSRSRSPRNWRSRSRSPNFRHADEFSGENKRRVKGQMPVCFDFRRGRCYRGASCHYLHHDSGKTDESRQQRSKQYLEFPPSSRTNVREEIKWISEKVVDHEHGEFRGPELKPYSNFVSSGDRKTNQKREDSVGEGVHNQDSQSTEYHMVKSEKSRDIPASVFETHLVENRQEGPNPITNENCQEAAAESHHTSTVDASLVGNITQSCGNASHKIYTSQSVDQGSLSIPLDPVCQNANCLPQQSDNSLISDSSPHKTCTSSPNRLPESNSHPNTMELHNHPSHIPSPSLPCSHDVDNPHMKQQQTASSMFQSSGESFASYMLPNQQSYFALQPNSSLTPLPPPPPLPPQDSSHFRQSYLPLRNDFGSQVIQRTCPTELPADSQSDGFQQRAYLPIQEANRPFLHASLPDCNLPIQQFGPPGMSRDNGLTQPPVLNVVASNFVAQGNNHPHTMPFSQQFLRNKMQPFPGETLPPGGLSNSYSYIHPYSQQQQQPPHSLHHPMVDSIYNLTGKIDSSLKDPPAIRDTTTHRVDIGGSTSLTFPNPYASTLDQPINSNVLKREKDTTYNNTPFSLTSDPVDGRGIGSQQATSLPNSARAIGQNFPRSGGDQYDPLFDSIEPSSRLSRKFDFIQKLEVTGDSDILLGLSGSNKPLDMEENNKRKDAGVVASAASADNEEFGETADAEVGAIENGSPSNPVEVNMATGEIEIDQIKSPGKSKKSKDSRSMKLFKVALADFVKEILKPSWQQGNMSKEAFKTIVKKTVDKVSGAMKSHQIPKSGAKIDHYIESSQLKLTKLVMGYVDKYVKV